MKKSVLRITDALQKQGMTQKESAEKEVKGLVPPVLVHKLKLNNPHDIADIFAVSLKAARYAYNYYRKWLTYGNKDYTDYELRLLRLFDEAV